MARGIRVQASAPVLKSGIINYVLKFSIAITCAMLASTARAQPEFDIKKALQSELAARREGRPFATSIEPKLDGVLVTGNLKTDTGEEYRFTSEAGAMLHVTDLRSGEKFRIIATPIIKSPTPGFEPVMPKDYENGDDLIVHSFRLTGSNESSLIENKFSAISTAKSEPFLDDQGGSLAVLFDLRVLAPGKGEKPTTTNSLCCVSCGSYVICGSSVTSSCGSCGGVGIEPENRN